MNLHIPIKESTPFLKKYAKRLETLNIYTFEDLLYHIPFRYEDYSLISPIHKLQPGEIVTVIGKVTTITSSYTKQKFKTLQRATITDDTGSLEVIWFNQPYLTKMIHKNDTLAIAGKIEKNTNKLQLTSPEYELLTENTVTMHTGRLVPIYHETKGVTSKMLRRQIYKIIYENRENFYEYLPYSIIKGFDLMDYYSSIEQIHFPKSLEQATKAGERLAFDELFFSQLAAIRRRNEWQKQLKGQIFTVANYQTQLDALQQSLPFTLTGAQGKALRDIFHDVTQSQPMNRLLEGDVGSGKTIVATIAMYLTYLNGYQSVLMAPTEILAQQHFSTVARILEPLGVKVSLQTGNKKGLTYSSSESKGQIEKLKKSNSQQGANKSFDILVGTHAVLSEKINFDKLGLVVIDEQQRFGVEQRAIIRKRGKNPHFLTMTATPIPRTIALAKYGDLDLSLLDELPKGRKIIKTWLVPDSKRNSGYQWIEKQLQETDSQAFIICPFIEESESMTTVKAATKEFEYLSKEVFPHKKLGLLHGRMKSKEKDEILEQFRKRAFDILVATPVVEVGIDIPNATIIVIEAADRFGLSQLHQLRGRVGRGEKQSYCLLFTESKKPQTITRLKAMETMHIGSRLAEFDLRLRGAGDIYGTAQHGQSFFKIATFEDLGLMEKAKLEAEKIFPILGQYPKIAEKLGESNNVNISPD